MTIMDKEYSKKYYEEHKEKIKKQVKEAKTREITRKIIKGLNENEYKRIPYSAIEKHNIKFNEETKKYYV